MKNANKVVKRRPPHDGIFLGFKKPKMRFFLERELVDVVDKEVTEAAAAGGALGAAPPSEGGAAVASVALLSSGCRSGRGVAASLLPSSASLSVSSEKPISPRFRGRGPACGRDSGAAVEEEADEAIIEQGSDWEKAEEEGMKGLAPGKD